MCDFKKISEEKESFMKKIEFTLESNSKNMERIEKELKDLENKANHNIRRLSFLL